MYITCTEGPHWGFSVQVLVDKYLMHMWEVLLTTILYSLKYSSLSSECRAYPNPDGRSRLVLTLDHTSPAPTLILLR